MFSLCSYQNTNLCSYQNVFISLTPSPTKIDPFDPVDPVAGSFPSQDLLLPAHLAQGFVGKVWSLAIIMAFMAFWWNMLESARHSPSWNMCFSNWSGGSMKNSPTWEKEKNGKCPSLSRMYSEILASALWLVHHNVVLFFWQNRLAGSSLNVWASFNANQTQSSAHGWIFDEAPPELFATDLQRTLRIRNTYPQKDRKVKSHQNSDENHFSILFRGYYKVEHPPSCPPFFRHKRCANARPRGPGPACSPPHPVRWAFEALRWWLEAADVAPQAPFFGA